MRKALSTAVVCVAASAAICLAQPTIPRDRLPADAPAEVRTQVEALYEKKPLARAEAAWRLGRMGPTAAPAVPFLIALLGDFSKLEGAVLLGAGPEAQPLVFCATCEEPRIVQRLRDERHDSEYDRRLAEDFRLGGTWVSDEVRKALFRIGGAAFDPLLAYATDTKARYRGAAWEVLERIAAPHSVPTLAALLSSPRTDAPLSRAGAAAVLGVLGLPESIEPLVTALGSESPWVREASAAALGKLGDVRALAPLLAALHGEPVFLGKTAEGLGGLGPAAREAVPGLVKAMGDPRIDACVARAQIARALGKIGSEPKIIVPALLKALGEPWGCALLAQAEIVWALGEMGPAASDAVPELSRYAKGPFLKDSSLGFGVYVTGGEVSLRSGYPLIMGMSRYAIGPKLSFLVDVALSRIQGPLDASNGEIAIGRFRLALPGAWSGSVTPGFVRAVQVSRDSVFCVSGFAEEVTSLENFLEPKTRKRFSEPTREAAKKAPLPLALERISFLVEQGQKEGRLHRETVNGLEAMRVEGEMWHGPSGSWYRTIVMVVYAEGGALALETAVPMSLGEAGVATARGILASVRVAPATGT